jgi:hypothetical protein
MIGSNSRVCVAIVCVLLLAQTVAGVFADVPARTAGGQALVVPQGHLDLGEVYHVTPGMGTQFMLHSDAPLLRMTATCNRVVGYFVTPFDIAEGQLPLLAGALRIPVASLTTASERFDQQLRSPAALSAAQYPEITFHMTGVSDSKLIEENNGRRRYTLTVAGQLQVKDRPLELELPMRLTLAPFTWQTMPLSVGDLLILRGEIDVKAADLVIVPTGRTSSDVAPEVVTLDFFLLCSTMSPERNLDPNVRHEDHFKQLQFLTLVRDFDDPEKGYEFGRAFMKEVWDDAPAINRLAWATLTEEGIKTRDLAFALEAAQRANQLTEFKDPRLLNTLARVQYERADVDAALKWARKAVEHIEDATPDVVPQIRAALQRYEARAGGEQDQEQQQQQE